MTALTSTFQKGYISHQETHMTKAMSFKDVGIAIIV